MSDPGEGAEGHRRAVSATTAGILLSRVLGYVRDVVITAVFGVGGVTDAYLVAFLIPNFFRRLAGEGALAASFIPIYADKEKRSREEAESFAGATLSFVFIVLTVVCLIAAVASPAFVTLFAPGLRRSPETFHLASQLLAALFPYLLMMSLYAVLSGILNTRGEFAVPASASALENICVITSALILVPWISGPPEHRIWGLVAGVLVGGILQVGVVWVALQRTGFRYRPSFHRTPELTEMLWLMLPAALTLVVYQLNNVVNQNIASFLPPGTITVLYLAYRVIEFPSALFGTAVGTVTLPKAAQASTDEEFRAILNRSVRMCLLWMIPSMAAFLVFAEPLIALMFQWGNFTAESSAGVARVLRVYAFALPFIGLTRILTSACYAVKAPKVPLRSGAVAVATNIVFAILFAVVLPPDYKACGIALGLSLAAIANFSTVLMFSRRADVLRGFGLAGVPAQAFLYLACSLVFAIPLAFLAAHTPQKTWTAAAIVISMGLYFGSLKLIQVFVTVRPLNR